MALLLVGLVFILALAGDSDANYCVCNSGLSDAVLQKSIDYACGAGADCAPIMQNGPCFNPNTVKDHCSYAVNSYYQKKGNAPGSCDFSGTATVSANPPTGASSACVYPSSASNAGGTTPPTGGTPTTPTPPGSPTTPTPPGSPTTPMPPGSPTTGGGVATPTPPGTFPGSGSTPGAVPGSPFTPGFGMAPTGSGGAFSSTGSVLASPRKLAAVVLISSLFCSMI